jgi:hypothetical protein
MHPLSGFGRWIIAAVAGATLLVVGIGVGTDVGWHHEARPRIAIGAADSSNDQITVESAGWAYDVPLEIAWYDQSGGEHFGSRPACIPPIGYVPNVHVQWVSYRADGATQRQVVAVDC